MRYAILLALLLLLPLPGQAATYSWTDHNGTMHFTDDIGAVPRKYRARALRQQAAEEGGSVDSNATDATPEAKPNQPAPVPVPVPAAPQNGATPVAKGSYGGKSGAEWQQQFRALKAELDKVEKEREEQRRQVDTAAKTAISVQQANELNQRTKQVNDAYEEIRQRYNQLVEQANKAGLPPEFAQ